MKTLKEIVTMVKDGEKPDYDDMRMAICVLDSLMCFEIQAFMRLAKGEKENKKKFLGYSAKWQYKETFNRRKKAMNKPPTEWLGESHNPDSPEVQERRKQAQRIYDGITKNI